MRLSKKMVKIHGLVCLFWNDSQVAGLAGTYEVLAEQDSTNSKYAKNHQKSLKI